MVDPSSNVDDLYYKLEFKTGTPYDNNTLDWNTYPAGCPVDRSGGIVHVNNHYYYDLKAYTDAALTTLSGDGDSTEIYMDFGHANLTHPGPSNAYVMHWSTANTRWEALTRPGTDASLAKGATTTFSPFTQGSSGNALPIDLLSFNGNCNGDEVELNFTVASQINNDYFTIYRSSNNKDWTIVGEISGAGNTSTQMDYSWTDHNPIKGTSYYQLSQTDYDGKTETFAPISVSCDKLEIEDYSAYPNPVQNELNIDIELDTYQGDNITLELVDINGRVAMQQKVTLERGFNSLNVEIADIPKGVYLLQFKGTKNHIKETRIVKQ